MGRMVAVSRTCTKVRGMYLRAYRETYKVIEYRTAKKKERVSKMQGKAGAKGKVYIYLSLRQKIYTRRLYVRYVVCTRAGLSCRSRRFL